MDIRQLLTYSDNCRRQLQNVLDTHPEAFDSPFETSGEFKTVQALIAHCIGAEQRWTERIEGQPRSPRYEDCSAGSLAGLFSDWEHVRAKTRAVIEGGRDPSQPTQHSHKIAFTLPSSGYTALLTIEECLFHVFNHQTYHLGQISLVLQQRNISPPDFDYVLLHGDPEQD